ncbi:alpha/beta hydrolase [Actinoplanes sp. NPDC051513]|uniref:alpha/beta hydrolase n=1 Tax=Actinoplanes sp. NPDC051513 TaxID=3363908 RepID=UPI003797F426
MRALAAAVTVVTLLFPYAEKLASPPMVEWKACPEDAKVECGTMRVPADWANPLGPTVMLTIARRPALDPAERIGTLVVNPGGPGGSAVNFTFDAPTFFSEELRKHFDIVGMDPRGVGRSTPILCSQDLVDETPSPLVGDEREFAALIDYNRRLAADCRARTGPVFGHVDTLSVVRDVDALRAALGEEKISFYGASYGSLMGEQYAEQYPDRLRALVLDGVMDHSVSVGTFLVQETDAAQDSFDEFVAWCARDQTCVLRGQDIPALWAGLVERAAAGTLENPYARPEKLRVSDLTTAAFAAFYQPEWYSFAYYLKDAAGLAVTARKAPPPEVDIVDHSFPPVICSDWYLPITGFPDLRRRLAILRARAPQMLASPLAINSVAACLGWPSAPPNPQKPFAPSPGMPPVLLIGSEHDPATTYIWAERMARQLGPLASLVTYEGWGHVVYDHSTCVSGAADAYLIGLTRPADGTICPAVEPKPFGVL